MTTAAEGNPYLDITDHGTVYLLGAYYKASSKPNPHGSTQGHGKRCVNKLLWLDFIVR